MMVEAWPPLPGWFEGGLQSLPSFGVGLGEPPVSSHLEEPQGEGSGLMDPCLAQPSEQGQVLQTLSLESKQA